ncbi:MAG: MFS transporter [Planctomycetaceae bacterium]|nr:MFS transporter [Planctomycetaceae bacterium]
MPPHVAVPSPNTKYLVLWALCISHLLNDTFQSIIPASLPLLKDGLLLTFTQVGLIGAVFQCASSVCQPLIGWLTDKHPQPYSLPFGMTSTLFGILLLSCAWSFPIVLISVALIGFGSAIFHPEASRLVYMASGGRLGFAQSFFQTGGNFGAAIGPLLAAVIITPYGQQNIAWFAVLTFCAVLWLIPLSRWYRGLLKEREELTNTLKKEYAPDAANPLPRHTIFFVVSVLLVLVFSKTLYTTSLSNFFTFYLIEKYQVTVQQSQLFLFAFLFAVAAGTMIGGTLGDRVGRKLVIWFSILGAAPFALVLPYVDSLLGVCLLSMLIGAITASSFPTILIFAQELMPGRVGTVGGLFFGFAFGSGAIAAASLGWLADIIGIMSVFEWCAYIPLIGLMTWFLPREPRKSL